jgi:hypothetical protein
MIDTDAPLNNGTDKSTSAPSTVPATAAFASREPIEAAKSAIDEPAGNAREEPSGRSTEISDMRPSFYG